MDNNQAAKKIEQAEYGAKLLRAELDAIKSSKAFEPPEKLGLSRRACKKSPRLGKKVVKNHYTTWCGIQNAKGAANGADVMLAVAEQTAAYQGG